MSTGAESRRARWFIAAHVGAVALLYAAALVAGGGFRDPFPPDEARFALAVPVPPMPVRPVAPVDRDPPPAFDGRDREAPWTIDADGRLRLRTP